MKTVRTIRFSHFISHGIKGKRIKIEGENKYLPPWKVASTNSVQIKGEASLSCLQFNEFEAVADYGVSLLDMADIEMKRLCIGYVQLPVSPYLGAFAVLFDS